MDFHNVLVCRKHHSSASYKSNSVLLNSIEQSYISDTGYCVKKTA